MNKNPNPTYIKRGKNTKLNVPGGKSDSSDDISSIKQNTIIKKTDVKMSLKTATERMQEQSTEVKRRKIERLPIKTLSKTVNKSGFRGKNIVLRVLQTQNQVS